MIIVKHLMDRPETQDGSRLWVEPVGLTHDFQEWCRVDHVLPHIGPPRELWEWFCEHPDGWEYFRGKYHEYLSTAKFRPALIELAKVATRENVTLLHAGDNPAENCAVALHEFLSELSAYSAPE